MGYKEEHIRTFKNEIERKRMRQAAESLKFVLDAHIREVGDILDNNDCKITISKKNTSNAEIIITNHARNRLEAFLRMVGMEVPQNSTLKGWITGGTRYEYSDVLALGLRPCRDHAENSIYIQLDGNKLRDIIIVLCQNEKENTLTWVTTLSLQRSPSNNIPLTIEQYNKLCGRRK